MAKLKLIDTKDRFLLEIDGTEIPYVTSYQITRTVSEVVLLKLALSVADVESVEIVSDKITNEKYDAKSMDTVQMNKKIKEIMDSSDFYLLSEDAAKAIGVAPQKLREQAKDDPEKLGFNVIVVGTSIRIPRIPFLNYILGSNPLKGV